MEANPLTRRELLQVLGGLGISGALSALGCGGSDGPDPETEKPPNRIDPPAANARVHSDNVRALMDVLLPAELDATGRVVVPGALEAGADEILQLERFVSLARGQGLLPVALEPVLGAIETFDAALRLTLIADLDVLAFVQRPLTPFRKLPLELQERAVAAGFADPLRAPLLSYVRAVCFLAFAGAIRSDVGLRAMGYPPFEDHQGGIAVSGYPRTTSGRLVDPAAEDLEALAAAGQLDDYTFNRAPMPTAGDSLDGVLDARGDLL